jgi:hypothetical protein
LYSLAIKPEKMRERRGDGRKEKLGENWGKGTRRGHEIARQSRIKKKSRGGKGKKKKGRTVGRNRA